MSTTSNEKQFFEPRLAINRVYTRRGDTGMTSLVGGERVYKSDLRIDCYGSVDELNAFVGSALVELDRVRETYPALDELKSILKRVQHELFNLGSILATPTENIHEKQPRVTERDIARLENEIDRMNADLSELRSFVLPGGSALNTTLHLCRTICRRAERLCVALSLREQATHSSTELMTSITYLNRLSDAFFVWSRWVNHVQAIEETLWNPNFVG